MLIIRDPVCIVALMLGFRFIAHVAWVYVFLAVGILTIPLALFFGHGNIPATLFGARILLLHFPLMFLYGKVFDRSDVLQFARIILLIVIPMTVLIALQFYLPQSHIVNVGLGGEGSTGFGAALGRFRPPGTFSFTNGLSMFYALAVAMLSLYLLNGPRPYPKWLWLSAACILMALPLSVSRTVFYSYIIVGLFTLYAMGLSLNRLKKIIPGLMIAGLIVLLVSMTNIMQEAMLVFSTRFESATISEGGVQGTIIDRFLGGLLEALRNSLDKPIFGEGIGYGSNVAARFLTGSRGLLISEVEWAIIVSELGPVLGLFLVGCRIILSLSLLAYSLSAMRRNNNIPFILSSMAVLWLATGITNQPTSLGFIVLACGLLIASLKNRNIISSVRPEFIFNQPGRLYTSQG